MTKADYLVVSPCRNEAEYARQTLDSMVAQTHPPALWVIVDDGSTDETPQILAEYAEKHDWIRIVPKPDRGHRAVGPGVIEAFYAGLETVEDLSRFEVISKLDLDLELPEKYYEILMARMAEDPKTQEWWTQTDPCQSPLSSKAEGEQWSMMQEVFHTD